jgi:amino acid permease
MMAIPRAYLQIGSLLGTAMLIGVALLIYFTLVVLVHGSAVTGAGTYSQLVLVTCGRPAMKLLQVAVLAFCFGFGVIYLVGGHGLPEFSTAVYSLLVEWSMRCSDVAPSNKLIWGP